MSVAAVAESREGERFLVFFCPACQRTHSVPIAGPGKLWGWNGSETKPSLSPAVQAEGEGQTCRSIVQDGTIYFPVGGSPLAGRTLALAEW